MRVLLFIFLLCLFCKPVAAFEAEINIGKPLPQKLEPLLFGANLQWTDNGDGLLGHGGVLSKQALKAINKLEITSLRFPGGLLASQYNWMDGIGPMDKRGQGLTYEKHFQNMLFGSREFLEVLSLLRSEGMITLNPKVPSDESQAWLEYVLSMTKVFSPAVRIPWWEVGNESYLPQDPSYSSADEYTERFLDIAASLHATDAHTKVGALLEGNFILVPWAHHVVPEVNSWNNTILASTRNIADFYSIHLYGPMNFDPKDDRLTTQAILASPSVLEEKIRFVQVQMLEASVHKPLFVTEYNISIPNAEKAWQFSTSALQAPYIADMLMAFARTGIDGAWYWSVIGNHNFGMLDNAERLRLRPAGVVFEQLLPLRGSHLLETLNSSPLLSLAELGIVTGKEQIQMLGAQALHKDGEVAIVVINRSATESGEVKVFFDNKNILRARLLVREGSILDHHENKVTIPAASAALIFMMP